MPLARAASASREPRQNTKGAVMQRQLSRIAPRLALAALRENLASTPRV